MGPDEKLESKKANIDFLLVLLTDYGNEVRSRREPELVYTAAAVGAFGAIAWGVATIATVSNQRDVASFIHPAIVAAIGSFFLATAIIAKIVREHRNYHGLREDQIGIARSLAEQCGISIDQLPKGFRPDPGKRRGYLWSIAIVLVAALAAIAFCISVWWFRQCAGR